MILLFFLLASEHWMIASSVAAIPRRRTRALVLGAVIGVVGLGIVVGGVALDSILVGVLGFLIMSFGVYWASTRSSGAKEAGESSPSRGGAKAKPAAAKKPQSSFMRNLENRWDERRNGS